MVVFELLVSMMAHPIGERFDIERACADMARACRLGHGSGGGQVQRAAAYAGSTRTHAHVDDTRANKCIGVTCCVGAQVGYRNVDAVCTAGTYLAIGVERDVLGGDGLYASIRHRACSTCMNRCDFF